MRKTQAFWGRERVGDNFTLIPLISQFSQTRHYQQAYMHMSHKVGRELSGTLLKNMKGPCDLITVRYP